MYTVLLAGEGAIGGVLEADFYQECTLRMVSDIPSLLKSAQETAADLIIVDLDLPGSRDPEVADCLQVLAKKHVILFCADQTLFDPSHPLTAVPAMDYLMKPYSTESLILTLETAFYQCDRRRLAAEAPEEESLRISLVRERIETYVQEHYSENLSMQVVAHVMNYSETHFCRLFKQCFKVNFSVYLNEYRVARAKEQLISGNSSVKEIALRCGYQDTSYFIRVFKRQTNMTPADYRIYARSMSRK